MAWNGGYSGGTTDVICKNCGVELEVSVTLQDGHNEREEFFCPSCGQVAGAIRASLTPSVSVKAPDE